MLCCMIGFPNVLAIAYTDVDYTSAQGKAILKMTECGVINGYPNGNFLPNGTLSRAEFAKIVNKTFGFQIIDDGLPLFLDVKKTDWAYQEIRVAQKAGYIQGEGNNLFSPDKKLTRQEICVIMDRIHDYQNFLGQKIEIKDSVADWARESVENAIACGLFSYPPNGLFRATQPITRGELCDALVQYVVSRPDLSPTQAKPLTPIEPLPDDNIHTDKERAKEAEVAAYLADIVTEYQKSKLEDYCDDAFVNQTIQILMNCMNEGLEMRGQGAFLSRDYLMKTFSDEIQTFYQNYRSMTTEQISLAKGLVSRFAVLHAIEVVTEYFEINL